jgi:PIN domain nuclease of toxin-antitoxin system
MEGEEHLSKREIATLDDLPADQRPFVCDISLWEVATLHELGRWTVDMSLEEWLKRACHPRTVEILPITPAIAAEISRLPTSFHRDPADRVIVSTARARNLALFTRDRRILDARLTERWTGPRIGD